MCLGGRKGRASPRGHGGGNWGEAKLVAGIPRHLREKNQAKILHTCLPNISANYDLRDLCAMPCRSRLFPARRPPRPRRQFSPQRQHADSISLDAANHPPELIFLHDFDPELTGFVQLASGVLTGKQIAGLFADAGGDPSAVPAYQLFKDFASLA